MVDEEGRIHCSLLLGKSRVNPKKFVSIPRLELTAAVLSVKMACLLKKELNLGEVNLYFWTDSKVVLGYIRNDTRRFKTFVVNRIYQIKENTKMLQGASMLNGKVQIVVGFKDLHSYGKKRSNGQIKMNQ